jgi:uncharacterized repeat protein (TIGR01451 family)
MFARSIRTISLVNAALLGALACGPVDPAEEPAAQATEAASAARQTGVTTLLATQDARTQQASGDRNFPTGILWTNTLGHQSFVEFDMTELPADARIESAELELYFNGNYENGENTVEVGRVDAAWDELTLTWNNQPSISWSGSSSVVGDVEGDVSWNVTDIVQSWQSGNAENHGFGLRSPEPGGKQYWSREKADETLRPRLVITYSVPVPPPGPAPECGDAPDSTNHHGAPNTAYPGVPGNFPTVYQVPAGQIAGPFHANATLEAFLGNFISREPEADQGPDGDGRNNILRTAAGAIVDIANQDFADDGLRDRNIRYYNCLKQTVTVRVSRPIGATTANMFLNAWFDGDRSGDWTGGGSCTPPFGGPAQPSTEWIIRDYPVDMTAIAPGSFVDLEVPTERIFNPTEGSPHWMRFTLSEIPAVVPPAGGLPDGRGPHPLSAQQSFAFGETEDYLQIPPPPGELGELVLEKRVIGADDLLSPGDIVTYQIRLTNEGGTGPAPAFIRDVLPAVMIPWPFTPAAVDVKSPGGAAPLVAEVGVDWVPSVPELFVNWAGTLDPDASITLEFDALLADPRCTPFQSQRSLLNVAEAGGLGGPNVSAQASFLADCPGGLVAEPVDLPIDLDDFRVNP